MRKLALLVIVSLALSTAPLAMAQGGPPDDGPEQQPDDPGQERDDNRTEGQDDGDAARDDRGAEGRERAERARLMGDLQCSDGACEGAFVNFTFDNETGEISDWTYLDDPVIESIDWSSFRLEEQSVHGSSFRLEASSGMDEDATPNATAASQPGGNDTAEDANETAEDDEDQDEDEGNETEMDDEDGNETEAEDDDEAETDEDEDDDNEVEMRLHDNPTGFIKLEAEGNNSLTVAFDSSVNVSKTGNWTVEVTRPDGFYAVLWTDRGEDHGPLVLDDHTVTLDVDDEVNVMFRVGSGSSGPGPGPDIGEDRERGRQIARAAAEGRIQAEVSVDLPDAASDRAGEAVAGTPSSDVVTFGNNSAKIRAEPGRVEVEIGCQEPGTVVVNVGQGVLDIRDVSEAEVTFDNETIPPAADLADVLNATDDEGPEFLLVAGAEGVQAMVSVDACSPHTIEIQEAGQADTPNVPAPGLAGVVAATLVAVAAVAHLKRRR